MVGRALADRYPRRNAVIGEMLFEVKDWRVHHAQHADRLMIKGINLQVRRGEVVGIAGLMGAGRTEFAMSVFGRAYGQKISGEARMHGEVIDISTVPKALAHRIAYVTEDRKALGLVLEDPIKQNISLGNLKAVSRREIIDEIAELKVAAGFRDRLKIKSAGVFQKVVELSGGNQQKVVLGKWLFTEPELLILDEPTRGIDVGAKYEIAKIINELAESGKAIILISSEMPELLGIADRIYVINEGAIAAEMPVAKA
jgi:putative multiple sugar transport system ATP-binding protein